jgi:hypothetical protein
MKKRGQTNVYIARFWNYAHVISALLPHRHQNNNHHKHNKHETTHNYQTGTVVWSYNFLFLITHPFDHVGVLGGHHGALELLRRGQLPARLAVVLFCFFVGGGGGGLNRV